MPSPRPAVPTTSSLLQQVGASTPLRGADVGAARERTRQRRLGRIAVVLGAVLVWMWVRLLSGSPVGLPTLPYVDPLYLVSGGFFLLLMLVMVGSMVGQGRSPHTVFRPEQINVGLDDVVGIDVVKAEVVRTLNLFWPTRPSPPRWAVARAAASCSREGRAPVRPTPPRRLPRRPGCRS